MRMAQRKHVIPQSTMKNNLHNIPVEAPRWIL